MPRNLENPSEFQRAHHQENLGEASKNMNFSLKRMAEQPLKKVDYFFAGMKYREKQKFNLIVL